MPKPDIPIKRKDNPMECVREKTPAVAMNGPRDPHVCPDDMAMGSACPSHEAKMEVRDLNLHYGDFHALKDISLSFPKNEVTALIGPSGCGKSTLLKTLNRMNDLVEGCTVQGCVELDGHDVYRTMPATDLRRRVGMVFQQPNPFPMSIYDNVAFGPRTHGVRNRGELDDIVESSLRDAAIWDEVKDRLKRSALGLSGGQQQRLCIARALAVKPEVLLLDESTSALDPISTAKIEELVDELRHRYTVIMVTHSQHDASFAHRVVNLFDGEIVTDIKNRL